MNSFEKEIQKRNQLLKSRVETLTDQNEVQKIIDVLVKAKVPQEEMLEEAKYVRKDGDSYVYENLEDIEKAKQTEAQTAKIRKVMEEFKNGTLKGKDGKAITDKNQAIAIAMSEAGISK